MSSFMCSYFMLTLLSSKMFFIRVLFFSCITLSRNLIVLLHANPKSLFVGVNKDKAHGGANLSTRAIVRCLIVILPGFNFHSTSFAFLASIIFQQEKIRSVCKKGFEAGSSKIRLAYLFFQKSSAFTS